ncbi:MAG: hypothetical protein RID09_16505 [Coleofasciculus sp. G1-WW12-02]|uniref:hypothetical protein n=1 Tax=Coleofasciculus sp. G1-WW12-02 TaxID=3068483 RepID=UPI0032FEE8BA
MSNNNKEQVILVTATSPEPPLPPESGNISSLMVYGGIAVAVILAMAYFSQIQLKSIAELLKTVNKPRK